MKSVLTLCAGLVLGGLVLWGIQRLSSPAGREGEEPVVAPTLSGEEPSRSLKVADPPPAPAVPSQGGDQTALSGGLPAGAGGPIFNEKLLDPASAPSAGGGRVLEGMASKDLSGIVDVSALEKERELSRATFDVGERDRARRMMERLYDLWKDNRSLDLTPEVERLIKVENRFARRREYYAYLSQRDSSGTFYEEQLRRGLESLADADDSEAAAFAAWEELTLAYELARTTRERATVLTQLDPFLKRMVFSGRSSPLLTTYTVKAGDNLSSIASRFGTTVGAIERLSGLASPVIQPRQRLRVLPGTVRVYVDKSDFRLWVTVDERFLLECPVGLGQEGATPAGTFVIRVKEKDPPWWKPGQSPIPAGDPRNILGSRWLGFADTEDVSGFGIHGTTDPSSIGRESSAGCVRLRQEDVELLFDLVPYRTEVVIRR